MPKYKFSDIAINVTDKRMPVPEDKEFYVAPNNLDTDTLSVSDYGYKVDLNGTKLIMHKGDMLFGRREPQLKHAAIAPHDGLFSAHGMILRPKTDVITSDFFPFFISSDYFFDAAIRISVGSLSPTVNWKDLKDFIFEIPSIEEQEKCSKVLWGMIRSKKAYKNLIMKTDELVKSQFVEMFGDIIHNNRNWEKRLFSEITTSRLGKMLDAKQQTGKCPFPYLGNANVQWFRFDTSNLNQMDFNEADQIEFALEDGDLLVCEGGEIGRCAVWHNQVQPCYFQKAIHRVRCNKQFVLPDYLAWWFKFNCEHNGFSAIEGAKATIAHLPGAKLKQLQVVVPPIKLQNQFVDFVTQLDKSKFAAKQALADLTAAQKALMRQYLG